MSESSSAEGITSPRFASPLGGLIYAGCRDGRVLVYNAQTGERVSSWGGHDLSVRAIMLCGGSDSPTLYTASFDTSIKEWEPRGGQCKKTFTGHSDRVWSIAKHNDVLYTSACDNLVKAWDAESGECILSFTGHTDGIGICRVFGGVLYSGADDRAIKAWNVECGECTHTFNGHTGYVVSMAQSGNTLYSGATDSSIREWDLSTGECITSVTAHAANKHVYCLNWADDHCLVSCGSDHFIKQWDTRIWRCVRTYAGHSQIVFNHLIRGDELYSTSADGTIRVWSLSQGSCSRVMTLPGHTYASCIAT